MHLTSPQYFSLAASRSQEPVSGPRERGGGLPLAKATLIPPPLYAAALAAGGNGGVGNPPEELTSSGDGHLSCFL